MEQKVSHAQKFIMIALLFLSLGLARCGVTPAETPVKVNMAFEVNPDPAEVGPSHLTVILTDDKGQPIEGATLKIKGDMGHDGMQPLHAQARAETNGSYGAPFKWTMGGKWALTISAELPDGQMAEQQFDLMVANPTSAKAHVAKKVPNNGAAIKILSPHDGMTFQKGDDIKVEIEYEKFDLGEDGNHWHIYLNDQSSQMIMGKMTDATLRDLEPGQHEISTYLSVSSHEELEEGAVVTINIVGPETEGMSMSGEADKMEMDHAHNHNSEAASN